MYFLVFQEYQKLKKEMEGLRALLALKSKLITFVVSASSLATRLYREVVMSMGFVGRIALS